MAWLAWPVWECFAATSMGRLLYFGLENLRPGVEVVGQKEVRLLGWFGGVSLLLLHPAIFGRVVLLRRGPRKTMSRKGCSKPSRRGFLDSYSRQSAVP